jgi:plastocyanin
MNAALRIVAAGVLGVGSLGAATTAAYAVPPPTTVAPTAPAPHRATVEIKDFMYAPRTLTIAAGTTVTWRNRDAEPHTVRGTDELVRSGALDQDETYSVRFDKPGTYRYGCSIHPQMMGTIIVQ